MPVIGVGHRLASRRSRRMLEAMLPMDDVLRHSGHYGPGVDVPDDADVQRLPAFIGRNPR
jgi:hypothetical protein